MADKVSNLLRVSVKMVRGELIPRVWQGDTAKKVTEMTQSDGEVHFFIDPDQNEEVPIAPLPPDEAAAAAMTKAEREAIHKAAVEAKRAEIMGTDKAETTTEPAEKASK